MRQNIDLHPTFEALLSRLAALSREQQMSLLGNLTAASTALPSDVWDTGDLSAYLKQSSSKTEKMRIEGNGPPYFIVGRRSVRYRRADVDQWLQGCLRRSTSDATVKLVRAAGGVDDRPRPNTDYTAGGCAPRRASPR